jgi:CsoR family transcriptional regulator, copper-sensing transcriptional repressor
MSIEAVDARLARIEGQVHGIRGMVQEARDCEEVLAVIKSARAALHQVAVVLLEDHASTCLREVEDSEARRRHMKIVRRFARG